MKKQYIVTILAGLFLLVANSGYWVNRYIFNEQKFSQVAVSSILSSDSRQAIAEGVSTKLYENRPIARRVLSEPTTSIVNGILGSPRLEAPLTDLVKRINVRMTSKTQPEVALDLTSVKSVLSQVVGTVNTVSDKDISFNPDNIPDKIVVVKSNNLPNLYNYSLAILWLSPITLIAGLLLMVLPYVWWRNRYKSIMTMQGVMLIAVGTLAQMIGPLFRPLVIGNLATDAGRTVIGNLYNAFLATFEHQSMIFFLLGGILLVARVLIHFEVFSKAKVLASTTAAHTTAKAKEVRANRASANTTAKKPAAKAKTTTTKRNKK
jgi:hypothetical protein